MLRRMYNRNPYLRFPLKISTALYSKNKRRQLKKLEEQEKASKERALKSFDDIYGKVYGDAWPSMRVALLCPSKEALLVNNYSNIGRIMNELEDKNLLSVSSLYEIRLAQLTGSVEKSSSDSESDYENDSHDVEKSDQYRAEVDEEFFKQTKARTNDDDGYYQSSHVGTKLHDDPTVNVPLEETLAAAKIDASRIVEPQHKGAAMSAALYEFIPATELMGKDPEWVSSTDRYRNYEESTNILVDVEREKELHFPPSLIVYSYERGNIMDYDPPSIDSSGTRDYEIIQLDSLLPVLALGIEPKDRVLDMFTNSTDFGLIMLQSLYPDLVVMNLQSDVRISEILNKLKITFGGSELAEYKITKLPPSEIRGVFNKILLCVPNIEDRKCLQSTQTYYHPMQSRDMLMLPDVQTDHLVDAIKLVQPGGTVVYTTTTLSPLQNEGVVRTAIGKLRYEHDIDVVVKDLTQALKPLEETFLKFASPRDVSVGHMVVPFLPLNCGPRYICKLVKGEGECSTTPEEIPTND